MRDLLIELLSLFYTVFNLESRIWIDERVLIR